MMIDAHSSFEEEARCQFGFVRWEQVTVALDSSTQEVVQYLKWRHKLDYFK